MELFTITCTTCRARLKVREMAAIGQILACPKCDSMVQVATPPGWQPPTESTTESAKPVKPAVGTGSTITLRIPPPGEARRPSAPKGENRNAAGDKAAGSEASKRGAGKNEASGSDQVAGEGNRKRRVAAAAVAAPLAGAPRSAPASAAKAGSTPPAGPTPLQQAAAAATGTASTAGRFHAIVQVCLQHWILASLVPVLSLAIVVCGWMIWGGSAVESTPEDEQAIVAASEVPEASPATVKKLPDSHAREFTHWLPSKTIEVVRLPVSNLQSQPAVEGLLGRATGTYDDVIDPLVSTLGLTKQKIRRCTWATTHIVSGPASARIAQGVAIVELTDPISQPESMYEGCPSLDLNVGEAICHQPRPGAWPHPFVLVDSRTILSGPATLLRELHYRETHAGSVLEGSQNAANTKVQNQPVDSQPKLISVALARAIELAGPDTVGATTQAMIAIDLAAARPISLPPALSLLDHWPEGRDAWHTVRDLPTAMLVRLVLRDGVEVDTALVCDERTAADKVHASLDQLAGAVAGTLETERAALSQRLVANAISAATVDKLDLLFARSVAALTARQLQIDDTIVWMRTRIAADPPTLATAATASSPAIEGRRLEVAQTLDEGNHQQLLAGLAGYEKAEHSWPLGAGGAALLPPENRLSWLATMLPYYGHVDWHRDLNFARPWNDAANHGVTRLPLEIVVNPALGATAAASGYPVTHYVGVSGIGADAGQLEASDPKAGVFGFQRHVAASAIGDGATNTIAILGVSGRTGPWAAGGDATVRPLTKAPYVNGLDGFGSGQSGGMLAGMADGSVRFLSKDIDPHVIEQLATINGGEAVHLESPRPAPAGPIANGRPATETVKPGTDAVAANKPAGLPAREGVENPSTGKGGMEMGIRGGAVNATSKETTKSPNSVAGNNNVPGNSTEKVSSANIEARLSEKILAIRFAQTTLAELADFLGQFAGVEITLDPQALAEAQMQPDEPLSIDLKNSTVRDVLDSVLAERGLGFVVEGNQVLITGASRQQAVLVKATYDVSDLTANDPQSLAQFAAQVRRLVEPSSWSETGGKGSAQIVAGRLVVEQNVSVQKQVQSFCEKLRVARGKSPQSLSKPKPPLTAKAPPAATSPQPNAIPLTDEEYLTLDSRYARAKPRLEALVSANFTQPTSLAQVLAYLRQSTGTQLLVDGPALATVGSSRETKVTLVAEKRPLSEALHGMLEPLKLVTRIVDGRTLQITSRGAWKDRLELEVYPAADLLAKDQTAAALLERVKSKLAPATWNDAGGPGVVEFDTPSGCLLVLQTQEVQVRLEQQLDTWRSER